MRFITVKSGNIEDLKINVKYENEEQEAQNIADLSCSIVDELVEKGFIKDCTDTNLDNEWESQDIIFEHIKKFINK